MQSYLESSRANSPPVVRGNSNTLPMELSYEMRSHHFVRRIRRSDCWRAPRHLAIQSECNAGAGKHGELSSDQRKTVIGSEGQPRGNSHGAGKSGGEYRGRRQTVWHRLRSVPWPRWPQTYRPGSLDVPARRGSYIARSTTILGSRIVLDCKEWDSFERYARLWQCGNRRAHLE